MGPFRASVVCRRCSLWLSLAVLAALNPPGPLLAQNREGLLLEYTFEGNSRDSSANGHHGTVHGDPEFASGKGGRCLMLDGDGDFVDSGTNFPELRETFTFECWVKPAATQNRYADILGNHAGGGITGYVIQQNNTNVNEFGFGYGNGSVYVDLPKVVLVADRWQHLAVVKTRDELRLYVNGIPVGKSRARGPVAVSTVNFRVGLGFHETSRCFRGSIDTMRVWGKALARFDVDVPVEEKVELFARAVQVEAEVSARTGLGSSRSVLLHVDEELVPAGVDRIDVTLKARERFGGPPLDLPPAVITRGNRFATNVVLPEASGYYQVHCRSTVPFAGHEFPMRASSFQFGVPPRPEPASTLDLTAPTDAPLPPPISLASESWSLATDPRNEGREQGWSREPIADAKKARVPGIIQEVFPAYHGVAWYWREFTAPVNPLPGGRTLLRFAAVDYLAEVWLNGVPVGGHEGGETPFVLDVTDAIRTDAPNLLAVRVLNPTNERIDGIVLAETPHRNKAVPYANGRSFNTGGITETVELLLVPAVRVENVYARPDPKTGQVVLSADVVHSGDGPVSVNLDIAITTARANELVTGRRLKRAIPPGRSTLAIALSVDEPHLWELDDPFLYRATARVWADPARGVHEHSVRFGFRDFRVTRGFFRLNGKRIFLRSTHTGNHCPVGQILPPAEAPDLLRRDLLYAKASGYNMVRFIAGMAHPWQLDLCDEIGLMVYEESYAAWLLADSPKMGERFDSSTAEMVRRDRNHPSVVIWGLQNEDADGPVFRHAVESLALVRYLDDTRLVLLQSGRWDGRFEIGSVSNPGSHEWERVWGAENAAYDRPMQWGSGGYAIGAGDAHVYTGAPLTAAEKKLVRTLGHDMKPVFLSEGGIGSVMHVIRELRCWEQAGANLDAEDAVLMRSMAKSFVADWKRLGMDGVYAFPEDMLTDSQRLHCRQRRMFFDLVRSNPQICGYNLTGMLDHGMTGEGVWRFWREWKPDAFDTLGDGWAPVRWCLFVEPMHGYAGTPIHVEAVLANEDVLPPGEYPVAVRVMGPDGVAWERRTKAVLPELKEGRDAPFAVPVLLEDATIDGPPGVYELAVTMERGGAPTGGRLEFQVSDPSQLPRVEQRIRAVGIDQRVQSWLRDRGVECSTLTPVPQEREVILLGSAPSDATSWRDLAERVARGSFAVFLAPASLRRGDNPVGGLFLAEKGRFYNFHDWLYHKECVARAHPVFDGLAGKGILDWDYYGPVVTHGLFDGQRTPDDVVVAAFALGYPCPGGYTSGVMMGGYRFGEGMFVINTLGILENVGRHPAADRLMLNLVRYAAGTTEAPLAPKPDDLAEQLTAIGF